MDIKTFVISENENTSNLLKLYLEEHGKFQLSVTTSDFIKAYDAIKSNNKVLVIVDISEYQEQALNFVSKISSDIKNAKIITLSDKPDMDLVIRAMRVGASDLIPLPLIKQDFIEILDKLYADFTGLGRQKSKCNIISVYSNKGGIGKTSIATNLALELAKITKENVALIDLNFQLGDITTFLDLKPTYNISYMLQNTEKINSEFLLSTLERYKETSLYVLADPPYFKPSENINLKNIESLFKVLRETFSYVIVDTSGGFDKKALRALELSDLVFLVTTVNLPAVRNCQRCLEMFDNMGFEREKIQIIINRHMENDEITTEDIKEAIGKNIYWKIPNNYFTMMSAINKGVPVSEINPDSNVALSYKNLALLISDNIYYKRI